MSDDNSNKNNFMSGETLNHKDLGSDDTENFKRIELNGETYNFPTSYASMYVDTYIELMRNFLNMESHGMVKTTIAIIETLTGIDREDVKQIPMEELKPVINDVNYLFTDTPEMDDNIGPDKIITINGVDFKVMDFANSTVGEALFCENLLENADDRTKVILDLIAVILRPVDENGNIEEFDADKIEERKEFFRKYMSVSQFHTLNFFLRTQEKSFMIDSEG